MSRLNIAIGVLDIAIGELEKQIAYRRDAAAELIHRAERLEAQAKKLRECAQNELAMVPDFEASIRILKQDDIEA